MKFFRLQVHAIIFGSTNGLHFFSVVPLGHLGGGGPSRLGGAKKRGDPGKNNDLVILGLALGHWKRKLLSFFTLRYGRNIRQGNHDHIRHISLQYHAEEIP
jgi:hypothetical protein